MSWRIVGRLHIILCHSPLLFSSIFLLLSFLLFSSLPYFFSHLLYTLLSSPLLPSPLLFSITLLHHLPPLPLLCLCPFYAFPSISTVRTHGLDRTAAHSTVLYRKTLNSTVQLDVSQSPTLPSHPT
jgi:hypothetical protein